MRPQAPTPIPTPTPLNPRQERFCQGFVVYATAATAAIEAGYSRKWSRKQGYRLLRTDRIRARIREIQSSLAAGHGRDMDVLLGKLEVVYCRAIEDHHFYAAARAVELQAKLGGVARLPPIKERKAEPAAPSSPEQEKERVVKLESVEI